MRKKKKRVDNSVLFMHERQWFFFSYVCIPYFLHSPKLAPCMFVCASNDAMQNAIDERATYIYIYILYIIYRERENEGVIRCSSCGTNLIPLHFFLAFSSCCWCWCVFSLSPPDISSSNSNHPTLTYKREKVPTHIHILTQRLGHALIYNIQKMTQSCRLPTKGLDMQNLDTTHSDDRQLN